MSKKSNFYPLPQPRPTGELCLKLQEHIPSLQGADEIRFHLVGDTGSFKDLEAQAAIAAEISANASAGKGTDFLYHLGDIVYHHGEASEYPQQFFQPYENYPGPIFAIAGNHDGDVRLDAPQAYQSLEPFMQVFCNAGRTAIPFAAGSRRGSINQPYVYWRLDTPLANIIGLYGNVAKFGLIDQQQQEWFVQALKKAALEKEDKALIITVHQSAFSADTNHGSSLYMIEFLDNAFAQAGVIPDLVFSGHVHNYQRFSKTYGPDKVVPYIVAGAGGYAILHSVAEQGNAFVTAEHPLLQGVSLENYCDDRHGFMRLSLKRTKKGIRIKGSYFVIEEQPETGQLQSRPYDEFKLTLNRFEEMAY